MTQKTEHTPPLSKPKNTPKPSDVRVQRTGVVRRRKTADYSKTYVRQNVSIQTQDVQMLYEHYFERVDMALFIATKAARSQGRIDQARAAENHIEELLTQHETDVEVNLKAVEEHLSKLKPEPTEADYACDGVCLYSVEVRTGYARRFLHLTCTLDKLICCFQVLEILNVFTVENSSKSIRSWVRWYRRLCHEIQTVRHIAMGRAKDQTQGQSTPVLN